MDIGIRGEVQSNFRDIHFLYFAENSILGMALIQKGHLLYSNPKFSEIFGYSKEEIVHWKKREFYKIVHPDDLCILSQKFSKEDDRTVSVQFRGIRKDGTILMIENYVCVVNYNGAKAYLSTYLLLKPIDGINNSLQIQIELPERYKKYFDYLKVNFGIEKEEYLKQIIENEIQSRNDDLNIF